ncbi:YciI family protein [Nocardia sp. CDC153]|uniref:YciI family protein n=1 Tax=Nocardia sp. CDC153 TaxID=3112167 RepID=UPI002DBE2821|nr:YciI family protein [Nocardia sp. CDC153]MEC3956381.1 YciI family protein [Nocardia sp. CDC153]
MPIFAVEYAYGAPGSTQAKNYERLHVPHLDWVKSLYDANTIHLAGRYADLSGALFVVEAEDETAVRELFAGDPFATQDVLTGVRVLPWSVRFGWL